MHAGMVGIISTGDIFNLYVFIEISSIASYGLISIGRNRHSIVAALEYLITGTISATFILVGIGFLYVLTGSLNMADIAHRLNDVSATRLLTIACLLFSIGVILKLAIFPMHFWLVRAYTHTEGGILTYIASISVISGFYILLRFIHSVTGLTLFKSLGLADIFSILSIVAIIFSSYLAYKSRHFRRIIFYSSIIQVGYITMMISNCSNASLILQYIFADGFSKFLFFGYIALEEDGKNCSNSVYITIVNIVSNLGLPITIGFFNKINLLQILLVNNAYIAFVAAIIASVVGVNYNFRMLNHLIRHERAQAVSNKHYLSLYVATIMSFGLIFYVKI
jgi:multicomponent Na+:H+ antiporter subunit D